MKRVASWEIVAVDRQEPAAGAYLLYSSFYKYNIYHTHHSLKDENTTIQARGCRQRLIRALTVWYGMYNVTIPDLYYIYTCCIDVVINTAYQYSYNHVHVVFHLITLNYE